MTPSSPPAVTPQFRHGATPALRHPLVGRPGRGVFALLVLCLGIWLAQVASDYAKYQSQPGADQRRADALRTHHVFGGIRAHETLTPDSALALVRWLIAGAK